MSTVLAIDISFASTDNGPVLSNWGMDCSAKSGLSGRFSELVAHTDIYSVVIADESTWSTVTALAAEPQLLLSRATGQIEVRLNQGAHTAFAGKYLYVLSDPETSIQEAGVML